MTTNTIGTPERPFTLSEMTDLIQRHDRVVIGFFVSQELWDELSVRLPISSMRGDLRGVKMVVDPELPGKRFDAAFTDKAWRERLTAIKGPNDGLNGSKTGPE
jgi:hypothetical protein